MAWDINGKIHSWENGGYKEFDKAQYMRDNDGRDAVGYVLGDQNDPEWAAEFADKILHFEGDGKGPILGAWGLVHDNCQEAFCRAVNSEPGLPHNGAVRPDDSRA